MGLNEIDFTSCPRVPGRAYNGANGKKIAELDFGALIDATPYLDELQRCFLLTYLRARRSKLFGL